MKLLNDERMRLVLVGIVAAIVLGGSAKADFTFDTPTWIAQGADPSTTTDGLTLFTAAVGSAHGPGAAIWVSTRETIQDDWGSPVDLGPTVNRLAVGSGGCPHISADSLTLFFDSVYPGLGGRDIWVSTRPTIDEPWSEPVNLGAPINSSYYDAEVSLSANGLALYFGSNRPGGYGDRDIWLATRETADSPWSEPHNLGPVVNTSAYDNAPSLSMDGRVLFFSSTRSGGFGERDLWMTRRATTEDPWMDPVNLGPIVNSSSRETAPCIWADGSILYFQSTGGVWQTQLRPLVDFNADGIVDAADMSIMVDHWGTDNRLCDIGPMPWGDGIVDVQDLIVLAEHLFEEFPPVQ